MIMDVYDGQMVFGGPWGLKLPDICLTGKDKPRENLSQETCPDQGSNPDPLRDGRACNFTNRCTFRVYYHWKINLKLCGLWIFENLDLSCYCTKDIYINLSNCILKFINLYSEQHTEQIRVLYKKSIYFLFGYKY